jgi:hypothetical protein
MKNFDLNGDGIVTKKEMHDAINHAFREKNNTLKISCIIKSATMGALRGGITGFLINGLEGAVTGGIVLAIINPILTGAEGYL